MVIHQLVVNSFNKICQDLKANAVSQPTQSLIVCVILVECKLCTHSCLFSTFSFWTLYCCSVPADAREFAQHYQDYEDFQAFVSQSTSLWRLASSRVYVYVVTLPHTLYQTFVVNIINNIRIHFIISFYVICAMIYSSFCCIYV